MTDTLRWPDKDPGDEARYRLRWNKFLKQPDDSQDTVADSDWAISPDDAASPGGLVGSADQIVEDDLATEIKLAGGVVGTTYEVTNSITTAAGDKFDRTVTIKIRER